MFFAYNFYLIPFISTIFVDIFPAMSSVYIVYIPFSITSILSLNSIPAFLKSSIVLEPCKYFFNLMSLLSVIVISIILE